MQFRLALLAALLISPAVAAMDMDDMFELHFGADVEAGKRFGDSATPSEFNLGIIDTMIHGRLSRSFSALAEIVYEDHGGEFGFDVERVVLNYEPRAWFRLSVGRFHTPLGYWNTAFHHARWMYMSTRAPLLAHFEDDQGPLPTHTIGVLVHGSAPAGAVRFEYDVAVGNGRGPRPDPPQQFADNNNYKSVCAALHVEFGGVRAGLSGLVDTATLASGGHMRERLAVADIHLIWGDLEAIAEGALIHHETSGVGATNLGGYVQVAYALREDLHLYGRGERFVRAATESYLDTPTASTVLGGVRYDLVPTAALKLEGGWDRYSGVDAVTVRGQLSWLF